MMRKIKTLYSRTLLLRAMACGLILTVLLNLAGFSAQCAALEENIVRLHVIANSVSYTHLDVYKRQAMCSSARAAQARFRTANSIQARKMSAFSSYCKRSASTAHPKTFYLTQSRTSARTSCRKPSAPFARRSNLSAAKYASTRR